MRKQREKEDFWDKHKDFWFKFSSDELDFTKSSLDRYSFDEKILEKKNFKEDDI